MNYKPIIVVLGEPHSVFIEIFLKTYKDFIFKNKKLSPIVLIGSSNLIKKQMKYFNYRFKIMEYFIKDIDKIKNNKSINIINVNINIDAIFPKKKIVSSKYIEDSFQIGLKLLKNKKAKGMINGPISKDKFLKKKFPGITEYLARKTKSNETAMLIYNKKLSVSPLTTHLPLKKVVKNINKQKIIKHINLIENFYKKILKKKPKIAILGLNPHCETTDQISEEKKIIIPAIKVLKKKGINVSGPYPADTFFLKENYSFFNLVLGMYHDQVLTPIKTIFNFDAINITLGLPFIRLSPDHGPNEKMISKGLSNPLSFEKSIQFFENIK